MDAANYLSRSTQDIRTSVETFTDEVEGELEKISVFGVHLTRRVTVPICACCVLIAIIVGVTVGTSSSSNGEVAHYGGGKGDDRFYALGNTIESSVGEKVFQKGTTEYQALQWLANEDPLQLPVNSKMEEIVERFVLVNLYYATNGPEWKKQFDFLTGKSVCEWNDNNLQDLGIYCDDKGKVNNVELSNNNLVGTLPEDVGLLTLVDEFRVAENALEGTVPSSLGIMQELIGLDLSKNKFHGVFSQSFGQLVNLENARFSFNNIQGFDGIGIWKQLPNLKELHLNHNNITGFVGDWGNCESLVVLDLSHNQITGTIPDTNFGPGKALKYVYFTDNLISGPIGSTFLKNLVSLVKLDAAYNQITGTLPNEVGTLSTLETLRLTQNRMMGPLPPQLYSLGPSLKILDLDNNGFSGQIGDIGKLSNLETLRMKENDFVGAIPNSVYGLTNLKVLDLNTNRLTEDIPTAMGKLVNLEELFLNDNRLAGQISPELSNLQKLRLVNLSNNVFVGDMDAAFCTGSQSQLKELKVDCLNSQVTCTCATHCCDEKGYCCDMMGGTACEVPNE